MTKIHIFFAFNRLFIRESWTTALWLSGAKIWPGGDRTLRGFMLNIQVWFNVFSKGCTQINQFTFYNICTFLVALRALLLPEACWIHVEVSQQTFPCLSQQPISLSGSSHDFCCCSCHSGPMRAYVLAREDAIHHWRDLMGPTKVFRARHTSPASIRAQFGLTDTRNTTHGSGRSPESSLVNIDTTEGGKTHKHRSKIILACFFFSNRGTLNKV